MVNPRQRKKFWESKLKGKATVVPNHLKGIRKADTYRGGCSHREQKQRGGLKKIGAEKKFPGRRLGKMAGKVHTNRIS